MSPLKFSHLARHDLQTIHDYIAKDNVDAAADLSRNYIIDALRSPKPPKLVAYAKSFQLEQEALLREIILSFTTQ